MNLQEDLKTFTSFIPSRPEVASLERYHKYGISYFLSIKGMWVKVIPLREV